MRRLRLTQGCSAERLDGYCIHVCNDGMISPVTMQQSTPGHSEIFKNISQSSVNTLLIFLTERKKRKAPFVQLCFSHHLSCVSKSTDPSLCFHSIAPPVPHSNSCFSVHSIVTATVYCLSQLLTPTLLVFLN